MANRNVRHRPPRAKRAIASRRGNITRHQSTGRYIASRDVGRERVAFLHATKGERRTSTHVGQNLTVAVMKRLDRVERIFRAYTDEMLVAYLAVLCWIAGGPWNFMTAEVIQSFIAACRRRWGTYHYVSRRDATVAVLLWLYQPAKQEAA